MSATVGLRAVLMDRAVAFLATVLFPGLAHRLRWPTRLTGRGLAAYIAVKTLFLFALRTWVVHMRRLAEEYERAEDELRQQLGREPTALELGAHLGFTCER